MNPKAHRPYIYCTQTSVGSRQAQHFALRERILRRQTHAAGALHPVNSPFLTAPGRAVNVASWTVDICQQVQRLSLGTAKSESLRTSHMRRGRDHLHTLMTRTAGAFLYFAFGHSTSGTVNRKTKFVHACGDVFVEALSAKCMSTRVNMDDGTHRNAIRTDPALL